MIKQIDLRPGLSPAAARKAFYDWLDQNRPWAHPQYRVDAYRMMEEMVAVASRLFTVDPPPPSREYVGKLESAVLAMTEKLDEHMEEGPCACSGCRAEWAVQA